MTKYEKIIVNPLGLGSTIITDKFFSDNDVTDPKGRQKLKLALSLKMCKVVSTDGVEVDAEAGLDDVKAELEKAKGIIEAKDKEIYTLKLQALGEYSTMDADELSKEYTIPELEFICNHEKISFKSNCKEGTLVKKIIEARVV